MSTKKRKKGAPKDATRAAKVLADARFDGQRLKLQGEGVYCAACGKYVGFVEVKHVLEHCFGSQLAGAHAAFATKTEEERVKLKHYSGRSTRSSVVSPYVFCDQGR